MSNLPPGCTGNEWQIAGAAERVISVDCEASGTYLGMDWDCEFSGDVDAVSIDSYEWEFTCPDCGREGYWTDEHDPPEERWED